MYRSTKIKAQMVKDVLARNFEPGRQDRCKKACHRNHRKEMFGISERTFFRYLKIDTSEDEERGQLTLKFDT